jgi:hypothetical protein
MSNIHIQHTHINILYRRPVKLMIKYKPLYRTCRYNVSIKGILFKIAIIYYIYAIVRTIWPIPFDCINIVMTIRMRLQDVYSCLFHLQRGVTISKNY